MEFFLPGLATLLIAALIVFLVLPRLGAPILAVLALILLAYGVYNHIQLFSSEYRYSTWQDQLKQYGPFVIIGALILIILMYMGFLFGTKGASALPASNVPTNAAAITEAPAAVANGVAGAAAAATAAATNAVNAVTNAVGLGNVLKPNNKGAQNMKGNGVIANLANILGAPATPNRKPNNRGGLI